MGTSIIPFNDKNGIKEINKILSDENIRKPFKIPFPTSDGLHRISFVEDGIYADEFAQFGTDTEVIFKVGDREVYRTKNATVLGGRISLLEKAFGLSANINQHLTLNKIMGIPHSQEGNVIVNNMSRKADYFMVGDGASSVAVPGKVFDTKNYETKLYNAIPFRFVPAKNDLPTKDRDLYRMRKIETIQGVDYIGYYAKHFDPGTLYLEYNDAEYLPKELDTAPVDENDSSHPLLGGSVLCYIKFTLAIEPNEMKEYFRAINGSIEMASMSEAGIVLAADLPNALDAGKKELADAELFSKVTSKPAYLDSEGAARTIVYKIYAK